MKIYLEKSPLYLNLMKDIFKQHGIPSDLVYISFPGPYIQGEDGSLGYWQLYPGEARKYGLKINEHIDERKDFFLSTQVAAFKLKELYKEFKDWRLSISAYAKGAEKVNSAVQEYDTRNYWKLLDKKAFGLSDQDFLSKVIAIRNIIQRPEFYGFSNLQYETPLKYKVVLLNQETSLTDISTYFNIPVEDLKKLNPKFNGESIHLEADNKAWIRVPAELYL